MPLDTSIPLQVQMPQFAEPVDPMERQMNALRMQTLQQQMQQNALSMQNTMEDRARAEAARRQTAAQAAQEKALKTRILQESGGDATKASRIALSMGRPDIAESYAKGRESIAKAGESEADLEKKAFANAYTEVSAYAPLVANGAIPGRAVVDTVFKHPVLGKIFSNVMTPDEALAYADKDPQGLARILATPPDKIYDAVAKPPEVKTLETPQGILEYGVGTGTARPITMQGVEGRPNQVAMPKKTEADVKVETKEAGRKATDETLGRLLDEYAKLNEMGSAPTETKSWMENVPAKVTTSAVGQAFNVDPQAQTRIQSIKGLRQDLVRDIKNATGMSAQEMNTDRELQGLLAAATDPNQNIESIKDRLADLSKRYGTGKLDTSRLGASKSTSGNIVTTPDGRVFTFKSAEDAAKFKAAAGL